MTTTTNDATPTQTSSTPSIDGELSETSLGAWIAEHKSLTITILVFIFASVLGFGVFNHFQTKRNNEYASKLFAFTQDELVQFREGKLTATDLVEKYDNLQTSMGHFNGVVSYSIELINALSEKEKFAEAYSVATETIQGISNDQAKYFLGIRAAALAENLGKDKEALKHLNTLISGSIKYMEDKIYLDLGRLQLKTGDMKKAKSSFQYVIDNGKEEEFKKMAKLYLSEL